MSVPLLVCPLFTLTEKRPFSIKIRVQCEQTQLHKSIKLLLRDAKKQTFETYFFLQSIDWRFLYKNFMDLCQIVCLVHGFEVKTHFSSKNKSIMLFQWHFVFKSLSFLNGLSYRCQISLELKIISCSFTNLKEMTNNPFR